MTGNVSEYPIANIGNTSVYPITNTFECSGTNTSINYPMDINLLSNQTRTVSGNTAVGVTTNNHPAYQSLISINAQRYPSPMSSISHYQPSMPINGPRCSPVNLIRSASKSPVSVRSPASGQALSQIQASSPVQNAAFLRVQSPNQVRPLIQTPASVQAQLQMQTPVQNQILFRVHAPSQMQAQVQNQALVQAQTQQQMQLQAPVQNQALVQVQAQQQMQLQAPVQNQTSFRAQGPLQMQAPTQSLASLRAQAPMHSPNSAQVQNSSQAQTSAPLSNQTINHQPINSSYYNQTQTDINNQFYPKNNYPYLSSDQHSIYIQQTQDYNILNTQNMSLYRQQMTGAHDLPQNAQTVYSNVNQYQVSQPSATIVSQSITATMETGVTQANAVTAPAVTSSRVNNTHDESINLFTQNNISNTPVGDANNLSKNNGNKVKVVSVQNVTIENKISIPVSKNTKVDRQATVIRTEATTFGSSQVSVVQSQAVIDSQRMKIDNQTTISTHTSAVSNKFPINDNHVPVISNNVPSSVIGNQDQVSMIDSQPDITSQSLVETQALMVKSKSTIDNESSVQNSSNEIISNKETEVAHIKPGGIKEQLFPNILFIIPPGYIVQTRPVVNRSIGVINSTAQNINSIAQVKSSIVENKNPPAQAQNSTIETQTLTPNSSIENLSKSSEDIEMSIDDNQLQSLTTITKPSTLQNNSQDITIKKILSSNESSGVPTNSREIANDRLPLKKRLSHDYISHQCSPPKKTMLRLETGNVTPISDIQATTPVLAEKNDLATTLNELSESLKTSSENQDTGSSISKVDKTDNKNNSIEKIAETRRPQVLTIIPENELVLLTESDEEITGEKKIIDNVEDNEEKNTENQEETIDNSDNVHEKVADHQTNDKIIEIDEDDDDDDNGSSVTNNLNKSENKISVEEQLNLENEVSSSTEIDTAEGNKNSNTSKKADDLIPLENDVSTSINDKVVDELNNHQRKEIELVTLDSDDEETDKEADIETEKEDNDEDDDDNNKSDEFSFGVPSTQDKIEEEQFKYTQSSIDEELDCFAIATNSSIVNNNNVVVDNKSLSVVNISNDDSVDDERSKTPLIMGVCSITQNDFETIDKSMPPMMMEDIVDVTDQEIKACLSDNEEDIIKMEEDIQQIAIDLD